MISVVQITHSRLRVHARLLAAFALLSLASLGVLGCKAIVGIKDHSLTQEGDGGDGDHTPNKPDKDGAAPDEDRDSGAHMPPDKDSGTPPLAGTGGHDHGGSSGSGSDSGTDAMTPVGDTECQQYCETVMDNCTGVYAVYTTKDLCNAVCMDLPEGDVDAKAPKGNSIACRLDQAKLAGETGEPWDHCPPAGPGGAGVCGENCESYCMLYSAECPDEATDDCMRQCEGLRDVDDEPRAAFDTSNFDVDRYHDGDYLQCRLVHVSSASLTPDPHCWHSKIGPRAGPNGEPNPCADAPDTALRCQDYCRLIENACVDDFLQYESHDQCMHTCGAFPPGSSADMGGENSLGCRKNHSYNALTSDVTVHCPHSGPGGHGVCGTNCVSYCTELKEACSDQFDAAFADQTACTTACALVPGADDPYTVEIGKAAANKQTLQCRILYTARAFDDASACDSALGGGDCTSSSD